MAQVNKGLAYRVIGTAAEVDALAATGGYIQHQWYFKTDVNGGTAYYAKSTTQLSLGVGVSTFNGWKVKSGATESNVGDTEVVEFTTDTTGFITASLTGKTVQYGVNMTGANAGFVPKSDGAGNIVWGAIPEDYIKSVAATTTAQTAVSAQGELTVAAKLSTVAGNAISDNAGLYAKKLTVHSDSQARLEITADNEIKQLALAITKVKTDTVASDIAAFVASSYTAGTEYQEGDVVILVNANEAYIHNGGSTGTIADFTRIETPGLSAAEIRSLFSAGNGAIGYNAATGAFSLVLNPTNNDAVITATGLLVDVSAGAVSDTANVLGAGANAATNVQALFDGVAALATTTHSNGVTRTGADIKLGGALTQATDVAVGAQALRFTGATAKVQFGGTASDTATSTLTAFGNVESAVNGGSMVLRTPNGARVGISFNNDFEITYTELQ